MKINFKKLDSPFSVPIYMEHIADVNSVGMSWTMFVGSADDESVGAPGLYHWFEHIPFRGTVKYPDGYKATKGYVSKYGGSIGANTSQHATTYHTHVPVTIWREALSTITDLMTQPLITDSAVSAEREIIFQEIVRKKSALRGLVSYELPRILWNGHAFGHPVLGSEQSLQSMQPHLLREAQKTNYDRSRCAFVVSGNINESELLAEFDTLQALIPERGLSARHAAVTHGQLPTWKTGKLTFRETAYSSSMVLMLFPLPAHEGLWQKFERRVAENMFDFGSLDAPLYRILREERNLAYSAELIACDVPGGGYWGFCVETHPANIDAVISALRDILLDPDVVSEYRLTVVKNGLRGSIDMRPPDPARHRELAVNRLVNNGIVYSDEEYMSHVGSVQIETVRRIIRNTSSADAHIVVFSGV